MSVLRQSARALDYAACNYGTSRLLFRGPQRQLDGKYVVCLGSTETFGEFVNEPYPTLLEDALERPCANMGLREAGIEAFLSSPGLLDLTAGARVTIIQAMGAVNMSNRLYTVDPRRNQRFIRASKRLKALYPEINFREFELTGHMFNTLARTCLERLQDVRRELQASWVARMRELMAHVGGHTIVLWLSDHAPYSRETGGTICRDPVLVDRAMLNALRACGAEIVEVVVTPEESEAALDEMTFSPTDRHLAAQMLGPIGHRRAAEALRARVRAAL